jgi:spermidine synthase
MAKSEGAAGMIKTFSRLLVLVFLASCLVPIVTTVCSALSSPQGPSSTLLLWTAVLVAATCIATIAFHAGLTRIRPLIDSNGREQVEFLDSLPLRYIDLAIFGSAALSLFLELAVIRWQGSVFEFFAFYKNFGLLSCFAGLGLGYALAARDRLPLAFGIPLLGWQFGLMIFLRFGLSADQLESIRVLPVREQLSMGIGALGGFSRLFSIYFFLSVSFLLTALTFIPIGQLCGRLMERRGKLRAYGLNLLGSLAGVLLLFLASALWTPPLVWFALCMGAILLFYVPRHTTLLAGIAFMMVAVITLSWPVNPLWQRVYSPYQLLEIGHGYEKGLMVIRAAGHYYQRVHNLSDSGVRSDPQMRRIRDYYELAYRIHPKHESIAIVGSGTGNDVAAALRSGATHVDAIEIDPAILMAGKANHPEKPYDDPRTSPIVNDARSFLRTTNKKYDLVVYGLLDSHTLLSHASSVRLDSFVYTLEGLREARARLKEDGVISLSFSVLSDALGRKIYKMLQEAFDGGPPICIEALYDGSVIYLESNNGTLSVPAQLLAETGFIDKTAFYANPSIVADVSTDDWPFFYMPRRIYPISYVLMLSLVVFLSLFLTTVFIPERAQFSQAPFFWLGAGFMLVETKGITEMGLTFGNTWQVIGIVIAGILTMAFLANCVVQGLRITKPLVPFLLVLASLGTGWLIARGGGFPSTPIGRIETAVVLTCPMFFSGIVFSTLLIERGEISRIMAVNLLGAMFGGMVEYNSMYFGFRFLYLMAIGFYSLAFIMYFGLLRNPGRPLRA